MLKNWTIEELETRGLTADGYVKHNKFGFELEVRSWQEEGLTPKLQDIVSSVHSHFEIKSDAIMQQTVRILADRFGIKYETGFRFNEDGSAYAVAI